MLPPRIAPYPDPRTETGLPIPRVPVEWLEPERRLFVVTRSGVFRGRRYLVGELLVCQVDVAVGSTVVIEAKGRGRPRLGTAVEEGFLGEGGEPCSPSRWGAAGRVVAVLRPLGGQDAAATREEVEQTGLTAPEGWVLVSAVAEDDVTPSLRASEAWSLAYRESVCRRRQAERKATAQLPLFQAA